MTKPQLFKRFAIRLKISKSDLNKPRKKLRRSGVKQTNESHRNRPQEFQILEQKYLQLEVSTARERAEMARQQEQLERLEK